MRQSAPRSAESAVGEVAESVGEGWCDETRGGCENRYVPHLWAGISTYTHSRRGERRKTNPRRMTAPAIHSFERCFFL